MTLRTALFSLALAAFALAAPPAIGTAHACGGYGDRPDPVLDASIAVTVDITQKENKQWSDVEIVQSALREDGSVWVSARTHTGKSSAIRRHYIVAQQNGQLQVVPTSYAFAERLVRASWVRA